MQLPTFRAGGVERFKRLTLLVGPDAVVRAVQFPLTDPAGSVDEMLALVRRRAASWTPGGAGRRSVGRAGSSPERTLS
ncbi:hypothetical protein ACGF7U_17490 [Micromonospora sp. NPDC047670]|uniref:hypothetical protein n=1 Tax=Micromonospora sp. NPDC047670 TaxID=3364252 RepID=UPI003718C8F2